MTEEKPLLIKIGRGGWTAHIPTEHRPSGGLSRRRISGYGDGWKKYAAPGVPVVDLTTMPQANLLKFALLGPMVDVDIEESESTEIEHNTVGLEKEPVFQMIRRHGHPSMRVATLGNLGRCTIADYVKLAVEMGATLLNTEGKV